jgi:hypothetical protein
MLAALAVAANMGLVLSRGVTAARADGDPASDVLLGENVFYPYTPPTATAMTVKLNGLTALAAKQKEPVKVALIASPVDLGVIPDLFGKPQEYADFLDREISFNGPVPLLVVMADGYGTQALSAKEQAAVAALPKPSGKTSTDLAQAAVIAVDKIAAANGDPLAGAAAAGSAGGSDGGGSSTAIIVGLLAAAAILTAVALAIITLRRRKPTSTV